MCVCLCLCVCHFLLSCWSFLAPYEFHTMYNCILNPVLFHSINKINGILTGIFFASLCVSSFFFLCSLSHNSTINFLSRFSDFDDVDSSEKPAVAYLKFHRLDDNTIILRRVVEKTYAPNNRENLLNSHSLSQS